MSKLKIYRVTAVQPVLLEASIPARSQKQAIKIAKAIGDWKLDGGDEINWNQFDIGDWYDYEAEEVSDD